MEYAVLTLKDAAGNLYYASQAAAAAGGIVADPLDAGHIAAILREEKLIPVAQLAAFKDPISPRTDPSMAIHYNGSALWLDARKNGNPWLNPYSTAAVEYVGDLVEEVQQLGFEQVVLTNVQFPKLSKKQDYGTTNGVGLGMSVKEAEKTINILSETRKTQTEILKSENAKSGSDICEKMLEFSKVYASKQVALPEDLWSYFSLENHLHPTTASYVEDRTYVMDFFTRMITYQKEQQKNVVEGFSEFLNMVSLYGMNILKKEIHNENDTVKLMTLHASKGLEFSHVFITGVNYGLIPLQTKSFEEEEEEQRLFFVGITRAKEHLELSYYTSPGQYRAAPGPSRYLRMIPGNLVEGQEKDKESSATHLQDLKRQILAERGEHRELQEAGKISGGKNPSANTGTKNISVGNETVTTEKRRVRHPKYGTGSVVREDDMMLTVDFDDYGEKELMKMFSGLEELP